MGAKAFFRQLGRDTVKFGRQLGRDTVKFGRQAGDALKLLPQGFRDASKLYSDLEKHTRNIPVVGEVFGGASKLTGGIGNVLGGNLKGIEDIKSGINTGAGVATKLAII